MKTVQLSKLLITLVFLFTTISIYAQEVIQESEKMTPEQKRVQSVEQQIEKIKLTYSKDNSYFFDKFPVYNTSERMNKKELNDFIQSNKKALYYAQSKGLQEKCDRINQLRKSINQYHWDECSNLNSKIDKLKSNNIWANEKIRKLNISTAEKEQHESDLHNLDKQINDLDAILAADNAALKNYESNSNNLPLDDYLSKSGKQTNNLDDILSSSNSSSGNNLDDLLEGSNNNNNSGNNLDDILSSSNSSSSSGNNLDDLLEGSNSNNNSGNNLDDILANAGNANENNFKIDYKKGIDWENTLEGVIDSRGKILIPYKNWRIIEYKMGIAKVKKRIETYKCPTWTSDFDVPYVNAYLVGFVGSDGEFIDGESVEFESGMGNTLYIISEIDPSGLNNYEYNAYLRKKEAEKRKKELKKRQCKRQENQWKKSIIANYQ